MTTRDLSATAPVPAKASRRRTGLAAMALAAVAVGCPTIAIAATDSPTPSTASATAAASVAETGFSLINRETVWNYLDTNVDPSPGADPNAWTTSTYDDSAWKSAKGPFGAKWDSATSTESPVFEEGRTATTVLSMRPTAGENIPAYFFRTTVNVSPEQIASGATITLKGFLDDAAAFFINGEAVQYTNTNAETPNFTYVTGQGQDVEFTLPITAFKAGENTFAVRVHNDRASSSDIWFGIDDLGLAAPGAPTAAPSRVILTPTETPDRSQSFTWLSGSPEETAGKIQIRQGSGPSRVVTARSQGTAINQANPHFSGTVKGLKAGSDYTYRVGNGSSWSPWYTFTTADPKKTDDFSYVYYGDAQVGLDSTWPKVVELAQQTAPDAIGSVHAGDLIDTSSNDSQWSNWFKGMENAAATTNILAAPGNHEYSGDRLMKSWKAHFEYPANNPDVSTIGAVADKAVGDSAVARQYQAYFDHWSEFAHETVYYVDYQGVRFITINATSDGTFLRPSDLPACADAECPANAVSKNWFDFQAAWLDHILSDSPSKWNVVTFHQPVYSGSAGRDEPQLRGPWVPVFQKHNIDLVQMGHDHVYARGFNNDNKTEVDGVTDGPVYVVQNSGAKHYNLETDAKNVWTNNNATQVRKGEDFSSFAVVDVSDDKLVYKSYIAEVTPSSTANLPVGAVWDEFVITKHDDGRKVVTEAGAPIPDFADLTTAPEITQQPAAKSATKVGANVRLSVTASGENLTYEWQRAPKGTSAWKAIENQDKATLVIEDVTANTGRYSYRVAVSAAGKTTYSDVSQIVVQAKSTVTAKPGKIKPGKTAKVTIRPSASGRVTVSVKAGAKTIRTTATVVAGRTTVVKVGKIGKKARGTATVTVRFTPADSDAFTASEVVTRTKIKR